MDSTIANILNNYRVQGAFHTHVSLISPNGSFNLNREGMEKLWDAYSNILSTKKNPILGIAEKPQHYLPVLADIDIKVRDIGGDIGEKLYRDDQVLAVIDIYQTVLRKIVDNCTDEMLICVLLEKKMYTVTSNDVVYIKHGFHLHFPYCFLTKPDQETHLIPRVKTFMKDKNVFQSLGFDDSSTLIDRTCCKVHWLMYGSRKKVDMEPYLVTKIFDADLQQISLEDAFRAYQIFDNKEGLIPIVGKVKEYLPRILSIVPYGRSTCDLKAGLISPLKEKIKIRKAEDRKTYEQKSITQKLELAKKLLPLISDSRADDYNEWMTIGWALYNISDGCQDGLDLWCEFSSRSVDKYDETRCIHEWDKMVNKDITLGTLNYYAKLDSPLQFEKLKEEESSKHVQEALCGGSHYDIAKALFEEFGDEFVCASISDESWYRFSKHKWEPIDRGVDLRQKISTIMVERIKQVGKEILSNVTQEETKEHEALRNIKWKNTMKLMTSLKTTPFKNSVMKEAAEIFYDRRFLNKLDTNPYLICFQNGVYDLQQFIFRPGRPEDFISKSLPIDYVTYTEDDPTVQDVHAYLETVFPDKSLRKYVKDVYCEVFVGGNFRKHGHFWTGDGDNSKSIFQLFFEKMLGPLAIKFNTGIITSKKPAIGSAFADLARAGGGVRWAVLEEPNGDESINVGVFKHLTGNDTFYARDLFQRGKDVREITPMFKLVFICIAEDSLVSVNDGMSIKIQHLNDNQSVIAWKDEGKVLRKVMQEAWFDKGKQNCLEVTLLDNRKIICTPGHKIMTERGWVKAEDLYCKDKLVVGLCTVDCTDILTEKDQYTFYWDNLFFDCSKGTDRIRAATLYRLLGYFYDNNEQEYPAEVMNDMSIIGCNADLLKIGVNIKNIKNIPRFLMRDFLAGYLDKNMDLIYDEMLLRGNKTKEIIPLLYSFLGEHFNMYDVIKHIGFRYNLNLGKNMTALISSYNYSGKYDEEYCDRTGLTEFLKPETKKRYFTLPVVNIKSAGTKNVYDISAEDGYNSFLSESVVVHNCNKLPRIKYADKASWNRIRVIPFESTFCRPDDPAPENYEDQLYQKKFPMDPNFHLKIPKMVPAFAWMLLEHRKKMKDQPLIEPDKVRAATAVYQKQNDLYRQFVDECIISDNNKSITLLELYTTFKMWFKEAIPYMNIPCRNEVEDYFIRLWGDCEKGKKWEGYRVRTMEDDSKAKADVKIEDSDGEEDCDEDGDIKQSKEKIVWKKDKEKDKEKDKSKEHKKSKKEDDTEDEDDDIILEFSARKSLKKSKKETKKLVKKSQDHLPLFSSRLL